MKTYRYLLNAKEIQAGKLAWIEVKHGDNVFFIPAMICKINANEDKVEVCPVASDNTCFWTDIKEVANMEIMEF